LKEQLRIIENRWNEDKKQDNENDYKEYLYLHHLIWLMKAEKHFISLGYSNAHEFERNTGRLKDIRNSIAHPVKSLIRSLDDLSILNKGLDKLYEFKGRLERYNSSR
jgi:predicted metal-dependent hydrolase